MRKLIFFVLLAAVFNGLSQAQPAGYYDGTGGLYGDALKAKLHSIIRGHIKYPYSSSSTDVWDILKETDKDPNNSNNVILLYTGWSRNAAAEYNGGSGWNREHVWPKSHGFPSESDTAYTDVNHLRPCDVSVNSARSDKDFDNGGTEYIDGDGPTGCYRDADSWEPRDEVKGDVARMIFYMMVRYEGYSGYDLEPVDFTGTSSSSTNLGKLSTLRAWHAADPVSDFERNRNDVVYSYQHNRNPFIDHPEFVEKIFTDKPAVFFTEYVEGSSNNKALEIGNETGAAVDLAADNYTVEIYANGSTTASAVINLTGAIQSHHVFVIANPSADPAALAAADQVSGSMYFNGNDAVVLKAGTTTLDVIGQIGFDPGTEWGTGDISTADNTIRRKAGIAAGDSDGSDAFDPAVEWDGFPIDTFDGLGSAPLPVELVSFKAISAADGVKLYWTTATETNNYGFEIQRTLLKENSPPNWEKIGFVEGYGNSASPKQYYFTDGFYLNGGVAYRLRQIDIDGSFDYSNVIEINIDLPTRFELLQNYPNPFNPTTIIRYSIPSVSEPSGALSKVTLKIYDVLGREITTLVNKSQSAGNYEVNFNGSSLPSGIYFYRIMIHSDKITGGNFSAVRKMILQK